MQLDFSNHFVMKLQARVSAVCVSAASTALGLRRVQSALHWNLCAATGMLLMGGTPAFGAQVEQAWAVQQVTPGGTGDEYSALTTDSAGNAYVASHAYFPTSNWDLILTKYDAAGTKLWQTSQAGSSYRDYASAVAVRGGSIFVAGTTFDNSADATFLTVKYNSAGSVAWTRRYNGPVNGVNFASLLETDSNGNVIVGGQSPGETGGLDFAVVKYDAEGNQLWVFRYDGPGQHEDVLRGLKVDAQGNIFLAGTSPDVGGRAALVTIKLNPDGQQLWESRYLASIESPRTVDARALALDATGNVITVGDVDGGYLTLKHSPQGNLIWSARYFAEEPASMSVVDVRVDGSNNIVTAGNLYGSGTNDAVVVKYHADGRQLWASRVVSHPVSSFHLTTVDMDFRGDTYLTGTPNNDALTVKIGANGDQLWRIEYNSMDPLYDYGEAIKVDATGNVFIAGRTLYFGTRFVSLVKYRQTEVDGGPAVSVSPTNQFVAPGGNVTITAAATGTGPLYYQWRFTGRPIHGATGPSLTLTNVQPFNRGDYSVIVSNTVGVTVSPEARLTVLLKPGVSVVPSNQVAYLGAQAGFTASFADTVPFDYYWRGTEPFTYQWRHEGTNISGATNAILRIGELAMSDAGDYSVVVNNPAGSVTSSVVSLTVSRTVEQVQALRSRGPDIGNQDRPLIKLTTDGETIVTGASQGIGTDIDIVVLKYGTNDQLLWSVRYNRWAAEPDAPSDLVLDPAGNVYITGYSGFSYVDRAFTTLKYSPEGQLLWARHFVETNALDNFATSIAVDLAGNVTVAGRAAVTALVVRYAGDGTELWVARGEDSPYERDQAVVVNAAGESYFGTSVSRNEDTDFSLRKLDSSGRVLWTRVSDTGGPDIFAALALDHAGISSSREHPMQISTRSCSSLPRTELSCGPRTTGAWSARLSLKNTMLAGSSWIGTIRSSSLQRSRMMTTTSLAPFSPRSIPPVISGGPPANRISK